MAMAYEHRIARYRKLYARLLRFYPKPYHARFGESMAQTFNDLCREHIAAGDGLFRFVLWTFADTFAGIVRENRTLMIMQYKNIIRIAIAVGLLLLIPLVLTIRSRSVEGMGWDWSVGDFIIMGTMLFFAGLALDFVMRKLTFPVYRVFAVSFIVMAFFLIWAELAVDAVSQGLELIF
jgi:hypothetical protein